MDFCLPLSSRYLQSLKSSADFFEKTRVQNSDIFFSVNQHQQGHGFGVRLKTGKFLSYTGRASERRKRSDAVHIQLKSLVLSAKHTV